jgi:hypothetical protein
MIGQIRKPRRGREYKTRMEEWSAVSQNFYPWFKYKNFISYPPVYYRNLMPPKNNASKKSENKANAKIIEDKTFGLKNKNKSSKVNKYIQQVEQAVKQKGASRREVDQASLLKKRKEEDEKKKAELAQLFKPAVTQPKVPFGVDPKTVLCAFWKSSGSCVKGDKCKYSHDPLVERKSSKINIYSDTRDASGAEQPYSMEEDTMDKWDQVKLEMVVTKKHGAKTTTEIVCKYFLEAIENKKYGWFWECPNGGDKCKYRHALPPGYVLLSSLSKKDEETGDATISLEEFLDTERHRIDKSTPVTADSFAKWKAVRKARAEQEEAASKKAREAEVKAGRLNNLSGRDLFAYQPDLFRDDEEAMEVDYNSRIEVTEDDSTLVVGSPDLFLGEDLENLDISNDDDKDSVDDSEFEEVYTNSEEDDGYVDLNHYMEEASDS